MSCSRRQRMVSIKLATLNFSLNNSKMKSKTCVKQPLSKRPIIGFQDQLSLNAGQNYCRMLQGEHSAILFQPSLSYYLSLRSLFCLFLNGHFTQVLLLIQKLSNKSYDLMCVEFSDGTIYSVNPDQTARSAYVLR